MDEALEQQIAERYEQLLRCSEDLHPEDESDDVALSNPHSSQHKWPKSTHKQPTASDAADGSRETNAQRVAEMYRLRT